MKSILEKYVAETFGKNQDQSFYDLDEYEQDAILAQIRTYANENKSRFTKEVRALDLTDELSPLPLIYEAIASDPDNWSDFFCDEIKRVLDFSLTIDKPAATLDNLQELIFNLDTTDAPHIRKMMVTLGPYLASAKAIVRREAIFLISGILNSENAKDYPSLVSGIVERLKDPDWRVRHLAYLALKDAGALPDGYKPFLLDQLRRQFFNPFK